MPAQRSRGRVRYALDDTNRLVVTEGGAAARLRPIQALDGSITVDRKNRLLYEIASGTDGAARPRAIILEGTWQLTSDHRLALVLHETDTIGRATLYLRGALVQAESNALVVALDRGNTAGGSTERLALSGRWAADSRNRLTFLVEKANGTEDRLTLQGGWELGPHHE